jgi:hypothetical protein
MRSGFVWLSFAVVVLCPAGKAQWAKTPFGVAGMSRAAYCFAVRGSTLFAGHQSFGTEGVSLSTDNGANWTTRFTGLPNNTGVEAMHACSTMVLAAPNVPGAGVYASPIGGTAWIPSRVGFPSNARIFALAASGADLFAGGYIGVYRSTDNGSSWSEANSGLPADIFISDFAVSQPYLFASNSNRYSGGVFRSTNSGGTWSRVNSGMTDTSVSALAVTGQGIFAGTPSGVFISTNNGTSWSYASAGIAKPVTVLLAMDSNLFAGTLGSGIFHSTNNGMKWAGANVGLADSTIWALAVCGRYLFAGMSSGVWRRPLSELVVSAGQVAEVPPRAFLLHQNYPNPFNPSTTIRYGLPERSHVSLAVYNTLGQQVAVLQNEEQEAGYHDVKFNASSLPSGVYFYRLQAGSYVETRKLCLVR